MTEELTTFLAFRLTDGEWQAMFLNVDGSISVGRAIPATELIELIEILEALKDKSSELPLN